ncbi:MAG: NAD(P)/FAD-dependent oxidoreductase [Bacilli bacterium]|jgi:thioredoxin reductase (NADPH)
MLKVIIIGAGPVGLHLAGRLKEAHLLHIVLEAGENVGGQLTALYPEKEIVDLPGIPSILARDYIAKLKEGIDLNNFRFVQEVVDIKSYDDHVEVITKNEVISGEYAIIATGLGFYKPKPLGLERESEFSNIMYALTSFDFLKDKRVAVFGGGDSALDWAKEISRLASKLYLVHRRREFRGNVATIQNIQNIDVLTPYVPEKLIIENDALKGITIKNVEDVSRRDLNVDYIMVNFGNIPSPVAFDIPKLNTGIICDEHRCVLNRVYVAGDAIGIPGKVKRIADGNRDADMVLKTIFKI